MKKAMVLISLMLVLIFFTRGHAEEYVIKDYTFTWHIIEYAGTIVEIQKTPQSLMVIFGQPNIPLCSLTITPAQASAIGELLKKTEEYYQLQKQSDDVSSSDTLFSQDCAVNFSSKQGREFRVRVKKNEVFGPVVLMTVEEAVEVRNFLIDAEQMASFFDKRVRP